MKIIRLFLFLSFLVGCVSKPSHYFVLTPTPLSKAASGHVYSALRIGVDNVRIPGYLDKTQLAVYCTPHQSNLDDHNLWAEDLSSNIKRIIKTNLERYLPGSQVENSPWDLKFNPNYHLTVNISQFTVDIHGCSILEADYSLYQGDHLLRNTKLAFRKKLKVVNPNTVVASMNANLRQFTWTIAKSLK